MIAMYETGNTTESPASSATDQLTIPDDDDASGRGPLLGGFSIAELLLCVSGASDDDDSAADLDLVHGDPCSGNGTSDSVRIATFFVNNPPACLGGKGHAPQETLPQRPLSLRQRQEVQDVLLGQGRS
jgi:hypothetical protein